MHVPAEMMDRYFNRRQQELRECLIRLENGDLKFLEKVGHKLKGNAVTFGLPELSSIGKELEFAARAGDQTSLVTVIGKYSDWVSSHAN